MEYSTIALDFVKVLYRPKWLLAVAALQVLGFYGLFRSLLGTTEQLYLAAGKPQVRTKLNLLQLTFREAGKIIEENFMYIAGPLLPAIVGSVIMMLAIWGWQDISGALSYVVHLCAKNFSFKFHTISYHLTV